MGNWCCFESEMSHQFRAVCYCWSTTDSDGWLRTEHWQQFGTVFRACHVARLRCLTLRWILCVSISRWMIVRYSLVWLATLMMLECRNAFPSSSKGSSRKLEVYAGGKLYPYNRNDDALLSYLFMKYNKECLQRSAPNLAETIFHRAVWRVCGSARENVSLYPR